VELNFRCPVAELAGQVKAIEKYGFHRIWVPDAPVTQWELWTAATMVCLHTERVRVGIGVTNPVTRSPAVIAHAAATLDQASGGRLDIALGRGIPGFLKRIGIEDKEPAVEECLEIVRCLLKGENVTYQGKAFQMQDIRLPMPSLQAELPIYIAAMGERSMRLAGRIAHGAITFSASPRFLNTALQWLRGPSDRGSSLITSLAYSRSKEEIDAYVRRLAASPVGPVDLIREGRERVSEDEIRETFTIADMADLAAKAQQLDRIGVSEIMVAYRRPDDIQAFSDLPKG
jgi:alkanesulfonate monooxygenase SsuD/methylene tetrahydromethanopterin reductase-like flavin-dependent oxidoreductase (luciferase family)